MRSLLGGRVLARHCGRRFAYAWPTGRRFGAPLTALWDFDDHRVPAWWSRSLAPMYPYRDETLTWMHDAQDSRLWQVRTAHELALPADCPSWTDELRGLRPAVEVSNRVLQFHSRHLGSEPYVGVMVRSHAVAHSETLSSSPLEWYEHRMHEIRERAPHVVFFISADSDDAFRRLASAFPGCVGFESKGPYNSSQALVASVADLYLLAGSSHLLGAHYSSFPELAQKLAGNDLLLETPRTGSRETSPSVPTDPLYPHLRVPTSW